jgi:class 3 adenylate cyclase
MTRSVMEAPETKYTKVGDSWVAYQVLGDGSTDLAFVSGIAGNIETQWEFPPIARLLGRLASSHRLIMFDRRGTGISDPVRLDALPTWEHWTEDLTAVLDAAGSKRTAILAQFTAGTWGMLFAGIHPDRTTALILWNSFARALVAEDYPIGISKEMLEAQITALTNIWGTDAMAALTDPSVAGDVKAARWYAKFMRTSISPGRAAEAMRYEMQIDVRDILPTVRAPTLILHRRDVPFLPPAWGRYLAEHIHDARILEFSGKDTSIHGEGSDEIELAIEDFLADVRYASDSDRVLATVLFTDIVGSTEHAATLGDRKWKDLLGEHDRTARAEIERFRGRLIKSTGDGVLATFDGPTRAIRCALALGRTLRTHGLEIRAGLHTGEIELHGDGDIGGIAVNLAARVMAEAGQGEVFSTRTVKDLVAGSEFIFQDHGTRVLKGIPEKWRIYGVGTT